MPSTYWNHNAAYHRWIVRRAGEIGGAALDVGAGEGLLAQRLASVCGPVTALEPDAAACARARRRLGAVPGVEVVQGSLAQFAARMAGQAGTEPAHRAPESLAPYAVITCVAVLHHMDVHAGLTQMRDLLCPGGRLLVVGLARNASPADWALSALRVPVVRAAGLLHRETRDIGVPVAPPASSLGDIRAAAAHIIPGARIRRRLYYRYTLEWDAPR